MDTFSLLIGQQLPCYGTYLVCRHMPRALCYSHVWQHQPVVRVVPAIVAVHGGEGINNVCAQLWVDLCPREFSRVAVYRYCSKIVVTHPKVPSLNADDI